MKATLYTKPTCPFCQRAKALLEAKGIQYEDHDVFQDPELRNKISNSIGGYPTVPMIFLDDEFIGGFSELNQLAQEGKI